MQHGLPVTETLTASEVLAWLRVARLVQKESGTSLPRFLAQHDGSTRYRATQRLASWAIGGPGLSAAASAEALAVLTEWYDL